MPTLSQEAIRLTRWLHRLLPDDAEVAGLLALMLLTDARRQARTRPDGSLVPLAEQDRQKWDQAQIAEGIALISAALPRGEVGPYQLQAAIAAVHDEAKTMADTDWPQILGLYDLLERTAPNPFTRSTAPWPWPWCTGLTRGWKSSRRWRRTSGWPGCAAQTPQRLPGGGVTAPSSARMATASVCPSASRARERSSSPSCARTAQRLRVCPPPGSGRFSRPTRPRGRRPGRPRRKARNQHDHRRSADTLWPADRRN